MRKILALIACVILSSCASQNLITKGSIVGKDYITADNLLSLSAPSGWQWTTDIPRGIVRKLASKLKRPREVALLINASDREIVMLIEAYKLTWGGRPITPAVLTSTITQERITNSCLFHIQAKGSSKYSTHSYECLVHADNSKCRPETPCLESWRHRISKCEKNQIVYERIYMIGVPIKNALPKDDQGWRISFNMFTSNEKFEESKIALDSVVGSLKLVN